MFGNQAGLEAGLRWGVMSVLRNLSGHGVDGGEQDGSFFPQGQGIPFSVGQVGYSELDTEAEEKQELESPEGEDGGGRASQKEPRGE